MKKILIALLFAAVLCVPSFAHHPHGGGFGRPPAPIHHAHPSHHHHHHRYVAPVAFGAGLVLGGIVSRTPVVVPSRVWVPGYYVTNYDSYGRPFQTYVPGHLEYR